MDNLGLTMYKHNVLNPASLCEKYRDEFLWVRCRIVGGSVVKIERFKRNPKVKTCKSNVVYVVLSPGKVI